jgi:hypothetical protein
VSLEDARERVAGLRAGIRRGLDPLKAKQMSETKALFGEFADALVQSIKVGFKNPSSLRSTRHQKEIQLFDALAAPMQGARGIRPAMATIGPQCWRHTDAQ